MRTPWFFWLVILTVLWIPLWWVFFQHHIIFQDFNTFINQIKVLTYNLCVEQNYKEEEPWKILVIFYHIFFLSNAIAEANNDNIQTLADVCYGLNNFERSRNRILYKNRNKKGNIKRENRDWFSPCLATLNFKI